MQLQQVKEALKICKTDTEKQSLENLKSDLNELLDLTQETLNEQDATSSSYNVKDPFADEMNLFMAEISGDIEIEPTNKSSTHNKWTNPSTSTGTKPSTNPSNKKINGIKVRHFF